MSKEPYVLMSLKEDKAKTLSQAINSKTAREILNYLSDVDDATETKIAEKLKVPISTVHYNLKNLKKANLVEVEEFHYSTKGKEVNHYKLANKLIIIAPKNTSGLKEKLKSLLPVGIISVGIAWVIQLYSSSSFGASKQEMTMVFANNRVADQVATKALSQDMAEASTQVASQEIAPALIQTSQASEPNIALWFLLGSICTILIMVIIDIIKNKRKK